MSCLGTNKAKVRNQSCNNDDTFLGKPFYNCKSIVKFNTVEETPICLPPTKQPIKGLAGLSLLNTVKEMKEEAYDVLYVLSIVIPSRKVTKATRNLLKMIEKLDSYESCINEEWEKMLNKDPSQKQMCELGREFYEFDKTYYCKAMTESKNILFVCGKYGELKKNKKDRIMS